MPYLLVPSLVKKLSITLQFFNFICFEFSLFIIFNRHFYVYKLVLFDKIWIYQCNSTIYFML